MKIQLRSPDLDHKTVLYTDLAVIGLAGAAVAGVIGAHIAKATKK